ncbi:MAG: GNAT family N-acetyltransferase [Deltaproteobacteria bacterium]|nr:GNAT family N-acetyltransferase [Deltaproteobacteria bacterium]
MADPRAAWRFETLSREHDRASFSSGVEALDNFLKSSARQNADAGISTTIVAVRPGTRAISGFFTLRMGEVAFDLLPSDERRRLPRYPVPVVHLARLAVDARERGKGLGEVLLMEAFARSLRASVEVPALAVEVVAKDDGAATFYAKYGFKKLLDSDHHMYLALRAVLEAFKPG